MSLATHSHPAPLTGRRPHRPQTPDQSVAILVAGAPGAGKRTFQQSDPDLPLAVRDLTTGAAHDPGTPSEAIRLDLVTVSDASAIRPSTQAWAPVVGAVVVVDTARLAGCFPMVDDLEALGVPFVVAVNPRPGREHRTPEEVRAALRLPAEVPVMICDCRDRRAVHHALVAVTRRALATAPAC